MENKVNELNRKIFSLFQIKIEDLGKNKFEWMVQHNIPTTVVDTWYYWEFEMYVNYLNERNKEENDQREKQEKDQGEKYGSASKFNPSSMSKQYNPGNMMKNFKGGNNFSFPRI